MTNNDDIANYKMSHMMYDIMPCGNRVNRISNDYVCELLMLVRNINRNVETIKKQIAAHDYNISILFDKLEASLNDKIL